MINWTTFTDREHAFSFQFPETTPREQEVFVVNKDEDGVHKVHLYTPDESEIYLEVRSYQGLLDHEQAYGQQKEELLGRSMDGIVSELFPTEALLGQGDGLEQADGPEQDHGFNFQGTLGERWKVRRFLFIDWQRRTYRIIYDPTSPLNEEVLGTFHLEIQKSMSKG